ncbi:MAG: hypothetical protein AB1461_17750 [Thermodesulfobacteriota bacterium]|jgi:hypothetical protein
MRFSFICTPAQAAGMERVIVHADGRVISRHKTLDGIIFEVEKT